MMNRNNPQNNDDLVVNVAVYMDRLDTYIRTSAELNQTLSEGLAKVNNDIDDLKEWKSKFYGAKALTMMMIAMFAHAGIILASVLGIVNWTNK